MNNYKTLDTKVNNKIDKLKHLAIYNSTKQCRYEFLCGTIKTWNTSWKTDLDRISLLIDLVIVEAIDQGKQQDALELVLKVKFNNYNFRT